MKKTTVLIMAVLLCLSLIGCGRQYQEETTAPAGTAQADGEKVRLPDFTVETADGGTFTLSEALEEKGAALVNLWATWCGYCTLEFPYLQEAMARLGDEAAVICLSIEPQDTPDVIRAYAAENGLTLPMGSAIGTGLESYADEGVPVTIAVDREGCVAAVHLGALSDADDFITLLNSGAQESGTCEYTVYFIDEQGMPVAGCAVSFCAGDICVPVFANDEGAAVYDGAPNNYEVKLLSAPEGYRAEPDVQTAGPYTQTIYFYLQKETP